MEHSEVRRLAADLFKARRLMVPVARVVDFHKEDAKQVKQEVLRLLSLDGLRRRLGYKVSMSKTWGVLFDDDVLQSPARLQRKVLFEPLIETEAVLHLERRIDRDMSVAEVLGACRVSAGIEVADSRFEGWFPGDPNRLVMPRPADTEADNAFASYVIVDSTTVPADSLPLDDALMIALRDGKEVAQGRLDFVMGHPANVVLWLARELDEVGLHLEAGQFVFTGNPYEKFVTISKQERAHFSAVLEGVGVAMLEIT